MNHLQGGSHREVERHMPSAALFKVKATNLSFYASATEGMTILNEKLSEVISQLICTTRNFQEI